MDVKQPEFVTASSPAPALSTASRSGSSRVRSKAPRTLSRMTNGATLPALADGRGAWARRLRDLIEAHISDLGGHDALSEAQHQLVRRAATLEVALEQLDAKFAVAEAAEISDLDAYQRASGNLRRLLESIGLERRAKPVDPIADYIRRKREAETAAAKPYPPS